LLPDLEAAILIADKAFDAQERVIEPLQQAGKMAVIPPKANRKDPRPCDRDLYKARHLIENFFAKLKRYRAIATRCGKRAVHFLGAIHLAAAVIWLNRGHALVLLCHKAEQSIDNIKEFWPMAQSGKAGRFNGLALLVTQQY
jgi:transposase